MMNHEYYFDEKKEKNDNCNESYWWFI